jgi:hypothetical protein
MRSHIARLETDNTGIEGCAAEITTNQLSCHKYCTAFISGNFSPLLVSITTTAAYAYRKSWMVR